MPKRLTLLVAVTLACAAATSAPQDLDRPQLLRDLAALASDAMEGREFGTPGGARARDFVVERFRASGVMPFGDGYLQTVTAGREAMARGGANVLGFVPGRRHDRYVVVSAHYDHIGRRNGEIFNGADDNASGTAALFAIAQHFTAHPPETSLLIAAFDGEEEGLLGSRQFLRSPPVPSSALAINLNADMLGGDRTHRLFIVGTARQPYLKPFFERVTSVAPVALVFGHEDRQSEDWTRDSDHWTFLQAGIPAVYLGVEDYEHHHKSTDDADVIDPAFYTGAVETVIRAIEMVDANLDAILAARPK